MPSVRLQHVVLVMVAILLVLALSITGQAQTVTPTPADSTPAAEDTSDATADTGAEPTAANETSVGAEITAEPNDTEAEAGEDKETETPTPDSETTPEAEEPEATETTEREADTEVEPMANETPTAAESELMMPPEAKATPEPIRLTVYSQNMALVKEVRTFDLVTGTNVIQITDVPVDLQPDSIHLASLTAPDRVHIVESSYEYDRVDSKSLLKLFSNQEISLVTRQGGIYTGTLLSGVDDVVLDTTDGLRIIALEEVLEFALPPLPDDLVTEPTIAWTLEADQGGEHAMRLMYLTSGLNWQANYAAVLSPDEANASLAGWVLIENSSGATYEECILKLVAGDVQMATPAPRPPEIMLSARATTGVSQDMVQERGFFEYHLYDIERPVTLRSGQSRRVEFVTATTVPVTKSYVLDLAPQYWGRTVTDPGQGTSNEANAQVHLEFANKETAGLGRALPGGTVRLYKEDTDGAIELIGEDTVDHTPADTSVSLHVGDAYDIVGERLQIDFNQLGKRSIEESIQVNVRNHKDEAVVVKVTEDLFRARDAEIVENSQPFTLADAHTAEFWVAVEPGQEVEVTYTVRYEW